MRRIYLDHTATTPLDPEVFEAMRPFFTEKFGNASSIHFYGQQARAALDESRDTIAGAIGASAGEVFFTGSGTEADNFALKGPAKALIGAGKAHIITSRIEHHAVLETCGYLEQNGCSVTYLPVDSAGVVNPEDVRNEITARTGMISVMHANNETGTVNPIEAISAIASEHGILFHTDAVQTLGKLPIDARGRRIDLLAVSAHKIYGPKGIGAVVIRKGIETEQLLHGGGQERGRRAGTENVPLAVGFARAVEIAGRDSQAESRRLAALKTLLQSILEERFPAIVFNGHPASSLPHILSCSFDSRKIDIDGEALLINLDLAGIAVTSGSACTSGSLEPSHVLLAMGRDQKTARATIRFSMGRGTTEEDVGETVTRLAEIVGRIGRPA